MKILKYFFIMVVILIITTGCGNKFNVVFLDHDDTIVSRQTVNSLDEIKDPVVKRVGYTFKGWKNVGESGELITYVAEYKANKYKISFNSRYETIPDIEIEYDEIVSFPNVTEGSHKFLYWSYQNQKVSNNFKYIYDRNITFTAVFDDKIASYKEFSDFLDDADKWLDDAKQFHQETSITYKVTASHPQYGSVNDSTKMIIDHLIDKDNYYYQRRVVNDGRLIGYEIYSRENNYMYFDTLVPTYNQRLLLETKLYSTVEEFNYSYGKFNEGFDDKLVYNKVSEFHYSTKTNFGNLSLSGFDLESFAAALNMTTEKLAKVEVVVDIIYDEINNTYKSEVKVNDFIFYVDGIKYNYNMVITNFFDKYNQEITPFDYYQGNVSFKPIRRIEDIVRTTDISRTIYSYERANQHYYRVIFEEGRYSINLSGINLNKFSILDSNQMPIDIVVLWDDFVVEYNNYFTIKNPGTYYIKIEDSYYDDYSVKFKKLD